MKKKIPKINAIKIIFIKEKFLIKINRTSFVLPKIEFELLHFFACNPNQNFSREEILKNVWGEKICVSENNVDVHIWKIREKLNKYSYLIETIKRVGYKFCEKCVIIDV